MIEIVNKQGKKVLIPENWRPEDWHNSRTDFLIELGGHFERTDGKGILGVDKFHMPVVHEGITMNQSMIESIAHQALEIEKHVSACLEALGRVKGK